MPSGARQRLVVLDHKDNKPRSNLVLIKKTGYANIWINNTHIYWDYRTTASDTNKINFNTAIEEMKRKKTLNRGITVWRL